jgi:hypothetical protein
MRGEPQDTNGAIQVQYERADTREYNRRGRGGEVEAGRDSRTWWHGGGLHAQRDCEPYTSQFGYWNVTDQQKRMARRFSAYFLWDITNCNIDGICSFVMKEHQLSLV